MTTNNHSVKDVLEDKSLVDPEVLESPQVTRRYAKGIVLCQQIGFSKGSYANLRQLKHFYTQLYGGRSPSYSLIIRRALDLLNQKIAMIKTHNELLRNNMFSQSYPRLVKGLMGTFKVSGLNHWGGLWGKR